MEEILRKIFAKKGKNMPRQARLESPTGYYHITQRGMGKQIIFEHDSDYERYLDKLVEYREIFNFKIIAYCLMNNHIHLLIKISNVNELSKLMRAIGTSYANYFNAKYEHSGAVFQNRFNSEIIQDDKYLFDCIKYIHNNPLKAGFSLRENYRWSSYNSYASKNGIADISDILEKFGNIESFIEFSKKDDNNYDVNHLSEPIGPAFWQKGLSIINNELGIECNNGFIVKQLNREKRNRIIRSLKHSGFTPKEIELLTGVSKFIICKL